MFGSSIESFPNDIVTTLLFPKTMHITILMEVNEDRYWYLLNKNEAEQMPSRVASHITLVDIHRCGHMLLSTFNHLLTLRCHNSEWKNLLMIHLNGQHFDSPMKTHENMEQIYGNLRAHSQCSVFKKKLKFFSKHSQNTNLSNLGNLHITDLETLCEKLLSF
jgi:hypothetical protein